MAVLDSLGSSLLVQNQAVIYGTTYAFTSYIVLTANENEIDMDSEDTDNADGSRANRMIYKRDKRYTMELIAKSDATPLTDFPAKDLCGLAQLSNWFVEAATIAKSRGPTKVSVTLINLGVT